MFRARSIFSMTHFADSRQEALGNSSAYGRIAENVDALDTGPRKQRRVIRI